MRDKVGAVFRHHCQTYRQTFFASALCAVAIDKGVPHSSLHPEFRVPIIPETRLLFRRKDTMDKFEEIGRRLDEELTRLRKYVEDEVAPETERRTAQFLREVSEKLAEASKKLETRVANRQPANTQTPKP